MTDSDKLDLLLDKVTSMGSEMKKISNKLSSIELHIENVTDKNIQTVAEGHLDISRKLDNALKVENEKELLIIRVRMLEDELRKVKEKIDMIA